MLNKMKKFRPGSEVIYQTKTHIVKEVYPYILYLKDANPDSEEPPFCVNVGDLVIAGLLPSTPGGKLK